MFEAYHDVTGAQHQTNYNRLLGHGYRMISLSVYGDPGDARYAAVWVQRQGPAWVTVHGVDSAGYQVFFDTWTAQGYVPVIISATGPTTNAAFAAVFEQGISGAWAASHDMISGPEPNAGTFQHQNAQARAAKMILRSFAIYGTVSDRRYAAVWHANPGFVKWHVHPSDTPSSYQTVFNAETQLPWYRPAYIALTGDNLYCSMFKDDMVGAWEARIGMTVAEYRVEFDTQKAAGFILYASRAGARATRPGMRRSLRSVMSRSLASGL